MFITFILTDPSNYFYDVVLLGVNIGYIFTIYIFTFYLKERCCKLYKLDARVRRADSFNVCFSVVVASMRRINSPVS